MSNSINVKQWGLVEHVQHFKRLEALAEAMRMLLDDPRVLPQYGGIAEANPVTGAKECPRQVAIRLLVTELRRECWAASAAGPPKMSVRETFATVERLLNERDEQP